MSVNFARLSGQSTESQRQSMTINLQETDRKIKERKVEMADQAVCL